MRRKKLPSLMQPGGSWGSNTGGRVWDKLWLELENRCDGGCSGGVACRTGLLWEERPHRATPPGTHLTRPGRGMLLPPPVICLVAVGLPLPLFLRRIDPSSESCRKKLWNFQDFPIWIFLLNENSIRNRTLKKRGLSYRVCSWSLNWPTLTVWTY